MHIKHTLISFWSIERDYDISELPKALRPLVSRLGPSFQLRAIKGFVGLREGIQRVAPIEFIVSAFVVTSVFMALCAGMWLILQVWRWIAIAIFVGNLASALVSFCMNWRKHIRR